MNEILSRASRDLSFREGLLDDPRAAILEQFGVELPPGYRIRFVEKPADLDALVVLPDRFREGPLDDDDLDAVAGGSGGGTQW